jgi:hypothetical protein
LPALETLYPKQDKGKIHRNDQAAQRTALSP